MSENKMFEIESCGKDCHIWQEVLSNSISGIDTPTSHNNSTRRIAFPPSLLDENRQSGTYTLSIKVYYTSGLRQAMTTGLNSYMANQVDTFNAVLLRSNINLRAVIR